MESTLYTIGHSNMDASSFIKLFRSAGITLLIDVRSSPYSKYVPQFNKEELMKIVLESGIKYLFMGNLLGGKPKDKRCYLNGKPDYDLIRQRDFYQEGLKRLMNATTQHRVAIICSEEDPLKCHRRNLIAKDLNKRGFEILHIRSDNKIEKDDFFLKSTEVLQGSLF